MTVPVMSVRVSVIVLDMRVAVPGDGLDVLDVDPLLVQREVLVGGSVGGFAPLEGRRLLVAVAVIMSVAVPVVVSSEGQGQERGKREGNDQLHLSSCVLSNYGKFYLNHQSKLHYCSSPPAHSLG